MTRPMPEIVQFPVKKVVIPPDRRSVYDIEELARSMAELGQLQPIGVREDGTLIYGNRRTLGAIRNGWETIEARVYPNTIGDDEAALMEIDENLQRQGLTGVQLGEALAKRKAIYLKLHPETKRGGDRGNQHTGGKPRKCQSEVTSLCQETPRAFVEEAAEKIGKKPDYVSHIVSMGEKLTPEVKELLRDTEVGKRTQTMIELSRTAPEKQVEVANQLLTGEINCEQLKRKQRAERKAKKNTNVSPTIVEQIEAEAVWVCQTDQNTNMGVEWNQPERITLNKDLIISANRLSDYYDKNQVVSILKLWCRKWEISTIDRVMDALNAEKGKR